MRHLSLCLCLVDLLTQRKSLPMRIWQLRCEVRWRLLWKQSGNSRKKAQKAQKNPAQRCKGKTWEARIYRRLQRTQRRGFLTEANEGNEGVSELCFSGIGGTAG